MSDDIRVTLHGGKTTSAELDRIANPQRLGVDQG